jgi:ubiquinone/menaquinone biosynthesis C-methylase UbiE
MPLEQDVSKHYTHGNLTEEIGAALAAAGKRRNALTVDDLAAVDEFHIGGRQASDDFLGQLGFAPGKHVLDVGCGIGGPARFTANRFGCRVTGIDLTNEYVVTGNALTNWVGLSDRVTLQQGSALAMPFADGAFDGAYMLHVGMNIEDKAKLFSEVARVLRPGAPFGVYDVMHTGEGELTYPVPWAMTAQTSFLTTPEQYKALLSAAGFAISAERDRRDFALDFFAQLRAKMAASGGPPPMGLHIVMGRTTPDKVRNMTENIAAGRIAPVELIAQKN